MATSRYRETSFCAGRPVGGGKRAPPPAEPHRTPGSLHIEKERRRRTPRSHVALALLGKLLGLLAVLAANCERKSPQPLFGNFIATLEAVAVAALFEPLQRVVDLVERFRLHLDERELDVFLDVVLRALAGVEHFGELVDFTRCANVAHLALNLGLQLPPASFEHLLELVIPGLAYGRRYRCRLLMSPHDAAPSLPRLSGLS